MSNEILLMKTRIVPIVENEKNRYKVQIKEGLFWKDHMKKNKLPTFESEMMAEFYIKFRLLSPAFNNSNDEIIEVD